MAIQLERHGQPQEFLGYVYPRIRRRFTTPLMNERNLQLAGDDAWEPLVGRVVSRSKPIAFVESHDPVDMKEAAVRAMDAGCPVLWLGCLCSVGLTGRVCEVFDLDALIADYRDLTAGIGHEVGDQIASELQGIRRYGLDDFLNFTYLESDGTAAGYARCGLLLGYPVETTAAVIGRLLGMEGCWTGRFGTFGRPPDDRTLELVERFRSGDGRRAEPWLRPYSRF